jgi:hypothetical protein
MSWNLREVVRTVRMMLVLYVTTYAILSGYGKYVWSQSGRLRWGGGFAVTDCVLWQPLGAHGQRYRHVDGTVGFRGNGLGFLFYPLILADQACIHPTRSCFSHRGEQAKNVH